MDCATRINFVFLRTIDESKMVPGPRLGDWRFEESGTDASA
jgi:hypothetical protein